jgi:hypothetical protein
LVGAVAGLFRLEVVRPEGFVSPRTANKRDESLLGFRDSKHVTAVTATVHDTLSKVLAEADLSDKQRAWAEVRWQREAVWMYRLSMRLRTRFTRVRTVAVFSSLVTPVAAGLGINTGALGVVSRFAAVAIGVLGAATIAIDQILRDGVRWRLYRATYDVLTREGWAYFGREGKYAIEDNAERFSLFFAAVEQAILDREEKYRSEVAGIVDRMISVRGNGEA